MLRDNIRSVLQKALFGTGRPHNRRLFREAHSTLFPGKKDFIVFLNESGGQNSRTLARKILHRLIYEHAFAPPPTMIRALAEYEELERSKKKSGYVPRDHFVHLVNLYMLGIYLFAYHKRFHKECCSFLNLRKRKIASNMNHQYTRGLYNPYAVFASLWTYFVMYHDLGYPFEPSGGYGEEGYRSIYDAYSGTHASVMSVLSVKAMAKYSVARYATDLARKDTVQSACMDHIENVTYVTADNQMLPCSTATGSRSKSWDAFASHWADARMLPVLKNKKNLGSFRCVTRDTDILGVIECTNTGRMVAMIPCEPGVGEIVYCFSGGKKAWPRGCPREYRQLWSLVFGPSIEIEGELEINYYVRSPYRDVDALGKDLGRMPDLDNLWPIISDRSNPSFSETIASQSDNSSDLGFAVFDALVQQLDLTNDEPPSDGENVTMANLRQSSSASTRLSDEVARSVGRVLGELMQDPVEDCYNSNILVGLSDDDLVKELYRGIKQKKFEKAFKRDLKSGYVASIARERRGLISVAEAYGSLKFGHLLKVFPKVMFEEEGMNSCQISKSTTGKYIASRMDNSEWLDAWLDDCGYPSFEKIAGRYVPDWYSGEENGEEIEYFDHSVMSTFALMTAYSSYRRVTDYIGEDSRDRASSDVRILEAGLGLESYMRAPGLKGRSWANIELGFLENDVAFAVLLHNLYPHDIRKIDGGRPRISLEEQPFVYLAMLADALQEWDREMNASALSFVAPAVVPGGRYSIVLDKDTIRIGVESPYAVSLADVEEKFRETPGSYLNHANTYIKFHILES